MTRALRMPIAAAAAVLALALPLGPALAAAAVPGPPATAPAAPGAQGSKSCPDYEFIGARGSGEDNTIPAGIRYTDRNPSLGMGGEVHDVFARLDRTARGNQVSIRAFGVPYPAVGIDVVSGEALTGASLSTYTKSVELGAHAAAAELERLHRSCPATGTIVAGYSQGAQVIVEAVLSASAAARQGIMAAVFFGNTYFDSSDQRDDYGSYAPGLDGYLVHSGTGPSDRLLGVDGSDWSRAFGTTPIFDYCHDGDPICGLVQERTIGGTAYPVRDFAHIVRVNSEGTGSPNIFTHHTDYRPRDTTNAAQRLRVVLGLPLPPASGGVDVRITSPPTVAAGAETTFNAGGTLSNPADPIASYRWTIDSGTADARTAETPSPLLSTAFFPPGTHTVALEATTVSGVVGQASVDVTVVAAPSAPPLAPAHVSSAAGDETVSLSWPEVAGADFYAVTDARGLLLTAFTSLVAGQQTVSWTDTGLKNGRAHGYRVYAVNSMGSSPAAPLVSATPTSDPPPAAQPPRLPLPSSTLMDPELVWAVGLGMIVVTMALALVSNRRGMRR